MLAFGERIKEKYCNQVHVFDPMKDNDTYTVVHGDHFCEDWLVPKESRLINCLVIREDLAKGQAIESFKIYGYLPLYRHKRVLLYEGKTIGHKAICLFPALRASKFDIVVESSGGEHALRDVKAYFVK